MLCVCGCRILSLSKLHLLRLLVGCPVESAPHMVDGCVQLDARDACRHRAHALCNFVLGVRRDSYACWCVPCVKEISVQQALLWCMYSGAGRRRGSSAQCTLLACHLQGVASKNLSQSSMLAAQVVHPGTACTACMLSWRSKPNLLPCAGVLVWGRQTPCSTGPEGIQDGNKALRMVGQQAPYNHLTGEDAMYEVDWEHVLTIVVHHSVS